MKIFSQLFLLLFCSSLCFAAPTTREVVDIYNEALSSVIAGDQSTVTNAEVCAASTEDIAPESYEQTAQPAQAKAKSKMCCEGYDKTGYPKNFKTCKDDQSRDKNPCIKKICAECAKCNPRLYCDFRTRRPLIDVYCTAQKPIGP